MSDAINNPLPGGDSKRDDDPEHRSINITDKDDAQRFGEIDKELAKYVAGERMTISKERVDELRKKIDRRVLVVMILTYFLQAIDKGTISFASIMGLPADTGMVNEDGSLKQQVNDVLRPVQGVLSLLRRIFLRTRSAPS